MRRFVKNNIIEFFLIIFVTGLFILDLHESDLGDYKVQLQNLIQNGSLFFKGVLIDRYPPITALIYYPFLKLDPLISFHLTILVLHLFFLLIIIKIEKKILVLFNVDVNNIKIKLLISLIVFNPYMIFLLAKGVNSELIYIIFSSSSIYVTFAYFKLKNIKYLIYLGLFIGLGLLTRTQAMALLIVILIFLLYYKIPVKRILIVCLMMTLIILPWQYLVLRNSNSFLSTGGLPSFRDGFTFNNKGHRDKIELPEYVEKFSNEFYLEFYVKKQNIECYDCKSEVEFVINKLYRDPKLFFELFWFKLSRTIFGTDTQNKNMELLNKIIVFPFYLIFLLSFIYDVKYRNLSIFIFRLFVLIYLCLITGMSLIGLSILRYQTVVFPSMITVLIISIYSPKYNKNKLVDSAFKL